MFGFCADAELKTLNGIIVLDTLQEQPATTLSMLRLNNPVLCSVQRLNTPKLWKRGGGGRLHTMWHKRMLSRFYFHLEPGVQREGGTGELEAKESISQLEH